MHGGLRLLHYTPSSPDTQQKRFEDSLIIKWSLQIYILVINKEFGAFSFCFCSESLGQLAQEVALLT
jgi:hypothetical protein